MEEYQKAELTAKITSAIVEGKLTTRKAIEKAVSKVIQDYFKFQDNLNESLTVGGWGVEDIKEAAKQDGYKCSDKLANDVLSYLDKHFDANIGITWDTIDLALDEKEFKRRLRKLPESEEADG